MLFYHNLRQLLAKIYDFFARNKESHTLHFAGNRYGCNSVDPFMFYLLLLFDLLGTRPLLFYPLGHFTSSTRNSLRRVSWHRHLSHTANEFGRSFSFARCLFGQGATDFRFWHLSGWHNVFHRARTVAINVYRMSSTFT